MDSRALQCTVPGSFLTHCSLCWTDSEISTGCTFTAASSSPGSRKLLGWRRVWEFSFLRRLQELPNSIGELEGCSSEGAHTPILYNCVLTYFALSYPSAQCPLMTSDHSYVVKGCFKTVRNYETANNKTLSQNARFCKGEQAFHCSKKSTTAVFPKDTTQRLLPGKQGQLRTKEIPSTGRSNHGLERPAKHVQLRQSFTDQLPLSQRWHMWPCFPES